MHCANTAHLEDNKAVSTMRIAIGSDEHTELTDAVVAELESKGHELVRFGALKDGASPDEKRWTAAARAVAQAVSQGECQNGILFCWTGTGVAMAANKVPNVRAALCADAQTAQGARRWNDANVLVMSLRLTSIAVAKEMLREWLITLPDKDEENQRCLAELQDLEKMYLSQNISEA